MSFVKKCDLVINLCPECMDKFEKSMIITEYASREMTLDEIEKELGYKVKIINKEEKNAEN